MRKLLLLTVVGALMMSVSPCQAEIPHLINYQGMLTQTDGTPLDGIFDLTFKIYGSESGDDSLWWEYHSGLTVTEGLFNVILGSTNPIPSSIFDDSERYFAIKVDSDPELSPRIRLTSMPYAYRALLADSALVTMQGSGSHWSVNDSVLYTNKLWGIARGGAGNALVGDSTHTMVNLGVSCTTGVSGTDVYYSTVSGGCDNKATGKGSTVGGGRGNDATDSYSSISGGYYNYATDHCATVGGGYANEASGTDATVCGGSCNEASGTRSTVCGGDFNSARGWYSVVGGGGGGYWGEDSNTAVGHCSVVPGGARNVAKGSFSFAAGRGAKALHHGSFVWADTTDADFSSTGANQFLLRASGGVGIGTASPAEMLHISKSSGSLGIRISSDATSYQYMNFGATNGYGIGCDNNDRFFINREQPLGSGVLRILTIPSTGNVGIGTTNPAYKLDVNGDINVSGNIRRAGNPYTHPDYVFESDYKLMSLDELKKYVFENKCLPNVISAEEVKKNNGYNMDELLIQMLEKIEEQTLYILQLEERIAALESEE